MGTCVHGYEMSERTLRRDLCVATVQITREDRTIRAVQLECAERVMSPSHHKD